MDMAKVVKWVLGLAVACGLLTATAGCAVVISQGDLNVPIYATRNQNAISVSVGDELPVESITGPLVEPSPLPAVRAVASQPDRSDRPSILQGFVDGVVKLAEIVTATF